MAFWNNPSELTPKQSHRWVISFGAYDDSLILQGATLQTIINSKIPYYFAKSVDRPSYEIGSQQVKYLYSHTFNFPKRVTWKPVSVTFYDVKISEYINNTDLLKNSNDSETIFISPKLSGNNIVEDNSFVTGSYGANSGLSFQKSTQLFFYSFLQKAGYFNPEELQKDDQLLRFRKYNFKKDMINALVQNNKTPNQDFDNNKIPNDTEKFHTITILELDESGVILEAIKLYNPLINDIKFDKLDYTNDNILTIAATINYDWAKLVPYVGKINKTPRRPKEQKIEPAAIGSAQIDTQNQYVFVKRDIFAAEDNVAGGTGERGNISNVYNPEINQQVGPSQSSTGRKAIGTQQTLPFLSEKNNKT